MRQNRFTLLYFILGCLFIFLDYLNSFIPSLIVKALLMPSLIYFYHTQIRGNYNNTHRLVMLGLGFAWIGDISLFFANQSNTYLISPENMLIVGFIAFLITQVFYILAFSIPKGKHTILRSRIYQTMIAIAYGFILIWYLYRSMGDVKFPVILYAIIIFLMLLSALNRYGKVNGVSYMLVVIGAIILVISDSMIAINKFQYKFDFAKTLIMITYLTAQYFIVLGCIRQDIIRNKIYGN